MYHLWFDKLISQKTQLSDINISLKLLWLISILNFSIILLMDSNVYYGNVYYKNQGLSLPNKKWEGPYVSTMGYFCHYHWLSKIYKWWASNPLPSYLKHGNVYYANFWSFWFFNFERLLSFDTYRWKLFTLYFSNGAHFFIW